MEFVFFIHESLHVIDESALFSIEQEQLLWNCQN